MSAENQDQDFAELQRLLKLKRHEQPPPRYFNDFSSQVTARLRSGDVGRLETFEDVVNQTPLIQRIWQGLAGRPAFSGVFAAGVCGLVVAGVFIVDHRPNELPSFAGSQVAVPQPVKPQEHAPLLFATGTNPTPLLPTGSSLFSNPAYTPGQTFNVSGRPLAPQ